MKMRKKIITYNFVVVVLIWLCVVCVYGFSSAAKEINKGIESEYVIKPDDTLSITVWKHPDLDRRVKVAPNGKISLPLIGDIQAAGLSPNALKDSIAFELSKDYIVNPYVTVDVEGKAIFIYGEVKSPGSYPLTGQMTVLKAVTAAGGVTEFASPAIKIKRKLDNKERTIKVDLRRITTHSYEDIILQADDIIVISRRIF